MHVIKDILTIMGYLGILFISIIILLIRINDIFQIDLFTESQLDLLKNNTDPILGFFAFLLLARMAVEIMMMGEEGISKPKGDEFMGEINNRLIIIHHYKYEIIKEIHDDAITQFQSFYDNTFDCELDVAKSMISDILKSPINEEYTFVIMGDCAKGGERYVITEEFRLDWIEKQKNKVQNLLIADFGESDRPAFIKDFSKTR